MLAIVVFVLIHVAVPAAGLTAFGRTRRRMAAVGLADAPTARLFPLCATYGGWLLVGLTAALLALVGHGVPRRCVPGAGRAARDARRRGRDISAPGGIGLPQADLLGARVVSPAMLTVVVLARQLG
jgi:hypothetical protein